MKSAMVVFIGILLSIPNLLSAGVLDELNHIPPQWDFLMYADARAMFDYADKKGIAPEDLPYFMGEKEYHDIEMILDKFNLKVSHVRELLAAGKLDDKNKAPGALVIIRYAGSTRSVPPEFRQLAVTTPHGTVYEMKDRKGEKVVLAPTGDSFVIGMRESVEYYLKSRKGGGASGKSRYRAFKEQSGGKCLYAHLSMSKIMKEHMDDAVKKGARMGKGLNANVFVKSIKALESLDAGV